MSEYLVEWKVEVNADSPEEAATIALAMQRDEDSVATCFSIYDEQSNETCVDADGPYILGTPSAAA